MYKGKTTDQWLQSFQRIAKIVGVDGLRLVLKSQSWPSDIAERVLALCEKTVP